MALPDRAVPRHQGRALGGGRAKLRGTIDVVTLQTLSRRDDIAALTSAYGLIIADECHHVPAVAFEDAVKQIPVRRWLGLTATPTDPRKLAYTASADTVRRQSSQSKAATDQAGGRSDQTGQRGTLEVLEVPSARFLEGTGSTHDDDGTDPRQVAVKVSPEGDRLITSGAHYLRMSKKDLVEAAVEFYLNARREEMQAGMRELLSQLDGSRAARVAMLAGMTREELEAVGGVEEDD